ncbi:BRCT domain-containing protein [Tricladium varicosporioides]|nr:BRCT domain-containing protein [Hymenoscyphus varicosporioides]
MAEEKDSQLFEHCVFAIVTGKLLPEAQATSFTESLEQCGGKVLEPLRSGKWPLDRVTHIISATSDFPQYLEARRALINVVEPRWITQSLLKGKQSPARPFTPDPNLIFSKINLSCADIPQGDKDAIIGAVLAMGGMESSSLTKQTTHICALTLDHPKCQSAIDKKLACKIVLPHWFDDCLKLGKRIDETPYELPDPEIFRLKPEDDIAMPSSDHIKGASTARPEKIHVPTDCPRRLDVFKAKTVMISEDLQLNGRTRKVIEDLINGGGGAITTTVYNADWFICQWREGRDYVHASQNGTTVGNLSWLYYLITHNTWTSPLRRLLHYPLPKGGLPGFDQYAITLSNYGGEARIYLENLVIATGATFTKSMKQENTHLITARSTSEKYVAAQEWNINITNHLWIEESYAQCQVQTLSDPRYSHFPPRTNLGEVIGQTEFDTKALESLYFLKELTPSPAKLASLKRPAMREKDHNLSNSRNGDDISMDGDKAEEEYVMPKKPAAKSRSKSLTSGQLSTPAGKNRRVSSAGKENDTPSSTRSAKDKALSTLHGLANDMLLYEKEKKRKGPIWGGERAANKIDKERSLERSSSPATRHEAEEDFSAEEQEEKRGPKRQRTGLPPIEMRLMITGYSGWAPNSSKMDADKKKLRELGVHVVEDPTNCTHLAAPMMVRTKKFLCALASGPTVVTTDFIEACIKEGDIPDTNKFALKDSTNEKKFGVKLKDVVVRAKANKRSLLRRVLVYCTQDIPNGPVTFQDIVVANGGTFNLYRGKPILKKTNPDEDDTGPEPVYLLSGEKPAEKKLWDSFTKMAKEANMIPRIVSTEWLLDTAMAQQHKWDKKYLVG